MIQVNIAGMLLDQQTHGPILLLHVPPLDKYLPIWIGPNEAAAIGMALKHERFERPLTHDLIVTLIDGLEGRVTKVVIHDLRESTFFAKIFIERGQQVIAIDARPSDSIAIAVRTAAPIYVGESVLEREEEHLLSLDQETSRRIREASEQATADPGESPDEIEGPDGPDDPEPSGDEP
jgi:bifunctional DNase/RNase